MNTQYVQMQPADAGLIILLILISAVVLIAVCTTKRKSRDYRRFLTDMYVSAKIRMLAKNDDLDIEMEELSFNNWNKKNEHKNDSFGLDDAVEDDLIERIEEPVEPNNKE